jgi:uncharacterized protein (DUF433 family)
VQIDYQSPIIQEVYGTDPRDEPIYTIAEVARYLRVHESTLTYWIYGREYKTRHGYLRSAPPLIELPRKANPSASLSFLNLVEAFNLSSLTRIYGLRFQNVRYALEIAKDLFSNARPLLSREFWTDNADLFVDEAGKVYNLSKGGQQEIKEIIIAYIHRVKWDDLKLSPLKVYPFTREIKFEIFKQHPEKIEELREAPANIEVDPFVAFGRPTITDTGIPVEVIASRKRAGDTVSFIAKDYGISQEQVQEAIVYERRIKKVA